MNYTSCGAGLASSFCAFLQFFLRCGVVCAPFSAGRAAALPAGAPGAVKRLPLHAAVHPAQRLLHRHRQRLPQPCTSAEHRHCSALLRSSAQQPAQHPSTPDPAQTKAARPLAGNTARSAPILAPSTVQAAISCPRAAGGSTGIIAAGGAENRPPVRWPYIPACRCGR